MQNSQITGFGYFAIVLIYLWAIFFQFGWGPVCWILVRYAAPCIYQHSI